MRNSATIWLTVALVVMCGAAWAAAPVVSNVVARQRNDVSRKVDITYKVTDSDSASVYVSVEISTDGGATYSARSYVTGHVGWVATGGSRAIVWDAKASLGGSAVFPNCKARITADDSSGGVYPGQMVYIPAGSFLMGNNGAEPYSYCSELPQHSVYLSGYWIGKYEVTRGEYQQFMNAGGYTNPAYWSTAGWSWKGSRTQPEYWAASQNWGTGTFTQTSSHPVVGVSYYEAEAFCNWAGGHLPTEAQWEKAARWTGSYPNVYPWGNVWDAEKCNNHYDHNAAGGGYARYQTAPVGSYPSGASPYGLHDMAGNVWEWCQDWYVSYSGCSCPFNYTNSFRVLRGGGWYSSGLNSRCAYRADYYPGSNSLYGGFRLAR